MFGIRILESYRVYGGRFYGLEEFSRGIFTHARNRPLILTWFFSYSREICCFCCEMCEECNYSAYTWRMPDISRINRANGNERFPCFWRRNSRNHE